MKAPLGDNSSIGDQRGVQLSSRLNNDSNELQPVAVSDQGQRIKESQLVEKQRQEIFAYRNFEYAERLRDHQNQFELKKPANKAAPNQNRDNEIDGSLMSDRESNINFQ